MFAVEIRNGAQVALAHPCCDPHVACRKLGAEALSADLKQSPSQPERYASQDENRAHAADQAPVNKNNNRHPIRLSLFHM